MKGRLITFEGSEGSGKSTQAKMVYQYLQERNKAVLYIREPGGVSISESIRKILLDIKNKHMTNECETLLYMAARSQLVEELITPALKKGVVILCDRFLDSTVVYQGYGNGIDIDFIKRIGKFATKGIAPDLTFLFDIGTKEGLSRTGRVKDRIEQRSLRYHNRVRRAYLEIARQEPERIKIIKVNKSRLEIQKVIRAYIDDLLR